MLNESKATYRRETVLCYETDDGDALCELPAGHRGDHTKMQAEPKEVPAFKMPRMGGAWCQ